MSTSAARPPLPPSLPPDAPRRVSRYPALLEEQLLHASAFARALDALLDAAQAPVPPERAPLLVWLLGRSDEVRALVSDVVREWTSGRLNAVQASDAIADYLDGLHAAVARWEAPACCSDFESPRSPRTRPPSALSARPRWDSEADTITESVPLTSDRLSPAGTPPRPPGPLPPRP